MTSGSRSGLASTSKPIVVADPDPTWPEAFERLRARIWPAIADVALAVEHVGSTAVPGLAAKPIIDMTVVAPAKADVPTVIARLATLGYAHRGDLGIEDREAFASPAGLPPHHLYACPADSLALANHLAVRDYLRAHPVTARAYGELKRQLAARFPHDIDSYVAGKTDLLLAVLHDAGLPPEQLRAIEAVNRNPVKLDVE